MADGARDGLVTEELVAAIEAAFNSRDVARIVSYFTEDGVFATARGPGAEGTVIRGRDRIATFLAERFRIIPDMYWHPRFRFVSGDYGVSYWVVTGTNSATGERLELNGCDIFRFAAGKIAHKDTFWKQREG